MDNITVILIVIAVAAGVCFFRKKDSAPADIKDSLPPTTGGGGKPDLETTSAEK